MAVASLLVLLLLHDVLIIFQQFHGSLLCLPVFLNFALTETVSCLHFPLHGVVGALTVAHKGRDGQSSRGRKGDSQSIISFPLSFLFFPSKSFRLFSPFPLFNRTPHSSTMSPAPSRALDDEHSKHTADDDHTVTIAKEPGHEDQPLQYLTDLFPVPQQVS